MGTQLPTDNESLYVKFGKKIQKLIGATDKVERK